MMVFLEAPAPRVECRRCGVVVAAVPWARPGARFTHAFEDSCAWLAARAAQSVVCELMRVTWRTVAGIVKRVVADQGAKKDLLAGLRRIGIDEIAHRYVGDRCQGLRSRCFENFLAPAWPAGEGWFRRLRR